MLITCKLYDFVFQLVWTYRKNLTRDDRFESAQKEVCVKELHEVILHD